uniref:Uncharacterized protein n=1 Tax=Heterosigma akashiwo TaxID=2829 RepID=A0A7S3Y6X5_HETAK|mmetsp:Transcript_45642/g.74657  ORF Transcript_45642/g.74657 Transcript_45642/m.74657 type:complete len:116 (-) Transcript_45642:103-450(-)
MADGVGGGGASGGVGGGASGDVNVGGSASGGVNVGNGAGEDGSSDCVPCFKLFSSLPLYSVERFSDLQYFQAPISKLFHQAQLQDLLKEGVCRQPFSPRQGLHPVCYWPWSWKLA